MRQLAMYAAVLVVTMGTVQADPAWSEYSAAQTLAPAEQLTVAACDVSIELRGAIAEVELRQRITNPGPAVLAATRELELPPGAQLVGMSLQRGKGRSEIAVPVAPNATSERVVSPQVLGADPAIIYALPMHDDLRPRFRVILQPIEVEQEVTLETRWTATADIRGGALQLLLPGIGDRCRALATVQPGPGAVVERLRIDHVELGLRSTASFELGGADATLTAVLSFKRSEPLVWSQTQPLGDGVTAQSTTVIAPTARASGARRALFVIDGSRSMELVGRHNVAKLVRSLGTALPARTEIEAIVFGRTGARILGAWRPVSPEALTAIETALSKHTAANGSDTEAAYKLARQVAGTSRETLMIVVTDGVLGDVATTALTQALDPAHDNIELHTIALAPGRMRPTDAATLRAPVHAFGGSYVELATTEVDGAAAAAADWLRPAWHLLALATSKARLPEQLLPGSGVTVFEVVRQVGRPKLTAHRGKPVTVTSAAAPKAQLAQLALAAPGEFDESARAKLRERHIAVDELHSLTVLTSTGTVAANRRAMIVGGGPYTRMMDTADPKFSTPPVTSPSIVLGGSAVDRNTVTLLLRQYLQPAAFTCYQRALAHDASLAGTVQFKLEIGRGELTRAHVTGVGNATFDACLLDAAYQVTPPLPNPDYNTDDRTIVNYPLTFSVREQRPFVVAGDADSSTPIDIDTIEGGVPVSARRGPIQAGDTSTPLGGLRPSPMK